MNINTIYSEDDKNENFYVKTMKYLNFYYYYPSIQTYQILIY